MVYWIMYTCIFLKMGHVILYYYDYYCVWCVVYRGGIYKLN